jgi:hypothetical protein
MRHVTGLVPQTLSLSTQFPSHSVTGSDVPELPRVQKGWFLVTQQMPLCISFSYSDLVKFTVTARHTVGMECRLKQHVSIHHPDAALFFQL